MFSFLKINKGEGFGSKPFGSLGTRVMDEAFRRRGSGSKHEDCIGENGIVKNMCSIRHHLADGMPVLADRADHIFTVRIR